jgi:hypothetical protein
VVEERHLAAALDELLGAGGELTKNLLGMGVRTAGRWHQELRQRSRGRHANGVAGGDYDGDGRNAEATPPDPPVQ